MTTMVRLLALIDQCFREEPFHTLHLMFGDGHEHTERGGTCSDKTLSFLEKAKHQGFDARIWTAFIGGREIHRLASVAIDGVQYFVDVGNGWPSLIPYPADKEIEYQQFGMTFRTELLEDKISVYHTKEGIEYLQMEIMRTPRKAADILDEVKNRFDGTNEYPFSNRMRYSAIVGQEFIFLRDCRLYIHSAGKEVQCLQVDKTAWMDVIGKYFTCGHGRDSSKGDSA